MTRPLLALAVVWAAFGCNSPPSRNTPEVVDLRPELREWCERFIDSLPAKGADTSGIVLFVERSTDEIHFPMFKHSYWIETAGSGKEIYDTIFGQPRLRTYVQGQKD